MPLNLTTPVAVNNTVSSIKITSFAVDIIKKEIHVAYNELDANLLTIAEKSLTIVEPDFTQAIIDANTNAGTDVYAPLKSSLYKQIQAATLMAGTVI